jgi:hypothetical protein
VLPLPIFNNKGKVVIVGVNRKLHTDTSLAGIAA